MIFTLYMEGYSTTDLFSSSVAEIDTTPVQVPVQQPELKEVPQSENSDQQEQTYNEPVVFPKEDFQKAVREEKKEPPKPIEESFNFQSFLNSDYFIVALLVLILAGLYYYFN